MRVRRGGQNNHLLDAAGCAYEIFDQVKANPSVDVVNKGVAAFKSAGADYMIAIPVVVPRRTPPRPSGIIINNPEFSDVVSLEGLAPTEQSAAAVIAVATAGTARDRHQLCDYR